MGRLQFAITVAIAAMSGALAMAVVFNVAPPTCSAPQMSQFFNSPPAPTTGGQPLVFKP